VADHPNHYRFHRPILWDNGNSEWKYSNGGTANLVRLCGEFFILTAKHCLEKSKHGWTLEDCRIPWRIQSEAYCKIGRGVGFSVRPGDPVSGDCELLHCDVQIHRLEGPSCPAEELEPGEFLDIVSFDPSPVPLSRSLSGFPAFDQEIDYENAEIRGIGWTIHGRVEATTDENIHRFHSQSLRGVDANGYSGGLITCDVLGNVSLEGICLQGSGSVGIDFVHFLGIDVLANQLGRAYEELAGVRAADSESNLG
jgi:hypothetical protein